jgi:hypothetical protein
MYEGEYHADSTDYRPGSDDDDQGTSILPSLGIYVLKYGDAGPDEMAGIVVAARSPFEARKLAAEEAGRDHAYPWAFTATCTFTGMAVDDVKPGVILSDYNCG